MKEFIGFILGIIGILLILAGFMWALSLVHIVCSLVFGGICLFALGSVILEEKI